jgi:hypothetical protein
MFATLGGWAFLTTSYKIFSGNSYLRWINPFRSSNPKQGNKQSNFKDWAVQERPFEFKIFGKKIGLHHLAP